MAEQNQKVRFAISVFHEAERLIGALCEFHAAGLDRDHLWLAGKRDLLAKRSALHDALAARTDGLETLIERTAAFGILPSGETLYGTTGHASRFMQAAVDQSGKDCLQALLEGPAGAILTEVEQGAVIVTARTESPALQDQCMRILLRHTRHMVFSRECRQGVTISRRHTIV
ncbi:MAG: hypothetical protein ACFCUR_19815 [Rhodomicrobiaceae bacterium]